MKPADVEVAGVPPPSAGNSYGAKADQQPTKKPWYKTWTCIIISSIIAAIVLAAIITAAVLGASYLQGKATSLPDSTLACTSGCYSGEDMAELSAPWARVLQQTVSDGIIDGVPVAVVAYEDVDVSPGSDLRIYTVHP